MEALIAFKRGAIAVLSNRFGGPPDYTIANLYYLKVRIAERSRKEKVEKAQCFIRCSSVVWTVYICFNVGMQGKTKNHPPRSLELIVENLVPEPNFLL